MSKYIVRLYNRQGACLEDYTASSKKEAVSHLKDNYNDIENISADVFAVENYLGIFGRVGGKLFDRKTFNWH